MPPPACPHIFELDPGSLRELVNSWGWPAFRSDQILEWVYRHALADPAVMTNLAARDRALLAERVNFLSGETVADLTGSDGTRKLLVRWSPPPLAASRSDAPVTLPLANGEPAVQETECVMIPTDDRRTACISTQVGCPVGCTFCASGIGGLDGNLTAGRIVEQVWLLNRDLHALGERISNVVFMGMGEPLANYAAVVRAVRTLMAPWGLHIGARRITISTVGLPRAIERLADEDVPVTLAISLHAPNDELRRRLIPWAEYTTITDLMEAGRYYFQQTGREVTLEYILLGGVNDQPEHADQLASVAKTLRANVNLIRYNEVAGLPYARPGDAGVRKFQDVLRQRGVNAHIRASRGRDIAAACGQLRHEHRAAGAK